MRQSNTFLRSFFASITCLFFVVLVLPSLSRADDPTTAKAKQPQEAESEREDSLKRVTFDIKYISSDEMGGRQPGTPGIKLCEDYIIAEFKKAGLKPLEDGTFLQNLKVGNKRGINKEATSLDLKGPNGTEINLDLGKTYQQLLARRDFDLNSDLVFVGYGISADALNYNDFEGINVEGKIVVMIRLEPQAGDPNSVFDGKANSRHATFGAKTIAARRAGAAGILMVNDIRSAGDEEKDELIQFDHIATSILPIAQIKRSVFSEMLKQSPLISPTGVSLDSIVAIEELIDRNLEPISQPIKGWSAKFESNFEVQKTKTNNIIGIIEGEGPNADQTIIIGGHYDHLGMGAFGSRAPGRKEIHNGADDNASGAAAVIELARRFSKRNKKPGRRIVFICFTAEEMGLLGAIHYCKEPIFPLEKTAAMVNLSMIGSLRNEELWLYNWNSSPQLDSILETSNDGLNFDLKKPASGFAAADHVPFHQRSVPNMFIHTGMTPVWYTPEDDFETINCEGVLKVIEFTERVVDGLASLKKMPTFGTPKPFRLGVRLNDENEVVTVEDVTSGSVAEKAGIQKGDVLLEYEGEKIKKRRELTRRLRRDTGKTVNMKLKRGDTEIILNVELKKKD